MRELPAVMAMTVPMYFGVEGFTGAKIGEEQEANKK